MWLWLLFVGVEPADGVLDRGAGCVGDFPAEPIVDNDEDRGQAQQRFVLARLLDMCTGYVFPSSSRASARSFSGYQSGGWMRGWDGKEGMW